MIKVTSVYKDNIQDSTVEIHGSEADVVLELKSLFASIIASDSPEIIHAVISYYLPKITHQIDTHSINVYRLSCYEDMLKNCKGGEDKID